MYVRTLAKMCVHGLYLIEAKMCQLELKVAVHSKFLKEAHISVNVGGKNEMLIDNIYKHT